MHESLREPRLYDEAAEQFRLRSSELGFSEHQFQAMWSDVKGQYAALPYHNHAHIVEVTREALRLADICNENNSPVNTRVLFAAALYHDAGYHIDLSEHGYESKEAYSAEIFKDHAPSFGLNADEIAHGAELILATKLGSKLDSLDKKVLVRSDIDNVGGHYIHSFSEKTALLMEEERLLAQLHGREFNRIQFELNSIKVLTTYLTSDLSLGEFDDSHWSAHAISNVRTLTIELAKQHNQRLVRFAQNLGGSVMNLLDIKNDTKDDD